MGNALSRIKEYIDSKGISVRKFEETVGLSNGSFASQFKNNRTIGVDKVENILRTYPDISAEWLLRGDGEMLKPSAQARTITHYQTLTTSPEQSIPIYDMPMHGSLGAFLGKPQNAIEYLSLPGLPKCDGAVKMYGNKMSPEIKAGDLVVYRKVKDLSKGLWFGQIYLLSIDLEGEEYIMIQYVEASDDEQYVRLVGANPDKFLAQEVPRDSIKALAMVKASIRYRGL